MAMLHLLVQILVYFFFNNLIFIFFLLTLAVSRYLKIMNQFQGKEEKPWSFCMVMEDCTKEKEKKSWVLKYCTLGYLAVNSFMILWNEKETVVSFI